MPTPTLDVPQDLRSKWGCLPSDILSQLFEIVWERDPRISRRLSEICKSWSECPTIWVTLPKASFKPHRFPHLSYLTLVRQPFGYQEAVMCSQMPGLHALCLIHPAPIGAFLEQGPHGQMLPAFCMLTQLTNLSLNQINSPVEGLLGISTLTNLRSFEWKHGERDVPWDAISLLPCLDCLTVGVPNVKHQLPVPDMTGLKILELRSRQREGCWNILNCRSDLLEQQLHSVQAKHSASFHGLAAPRYHRIRRPICCGLGAASFVDFSD